MKLAKRLGMRVSLWAIALVCVVAGPLACADRLLDFSGELWRVRSDAGDPGTGCFSDSRDSVWIDENGWLHLKLRYIDNRWCQAEVVSVNPATYGTYEFVAEILDDSFPQSGVLGLFLFADIQREIDIELTHAFTSGWKFVRHTVQPGDKESCAKDGLHCDFWMERIKGVSRHQIQWYPGHVVTTSGLLDCYLPHCQPGVGTWSVAGVEVPEVADDFRVHINLWLCHLDWCDKFRAPDGGGYEIVIRSVRRLPLLYRED